MEQVTKQEIKALTESVKRIETALLGDHAMRIEGMAEKVEKHEKYISKAKTRFAWGTGLAGGFGFALHQIVEFFKGH